MRVMRHTLCISSFLAVVLLGACAPSVKPGVDFQETAPPARADSFPNWTLPPDKAAEVFGKSAETPLSAKGTLHGISGAVKADLFFEDIQKDVLVKWKEMPPPPRIDNYNNSPRKELAAYEIQKFFLEPEDYVVPTTLARCPEINNFRKLFPKAEPSIPKTNCKLGIIALWLKDVRIPENAGDVYDDDRFRTDPVYAYYLSNVNIVMYLIDHRDARASNFLVATDDKRRQVFSPDNGTSFSPAFYNPFLRGWNEIRLPAIRKASVDRLRKIQRQDLDSLLVLNQLELDDDGIYRVVDPVAPAPSERDRAVRITEKTIQLGLRDSEIDGLYERIQELIEQVDSGKVAVF